MHILSEETYRPETRVRSVSGVDLFVQERIIDRMTDHAHEGLMSDSEIMGLMVGRRYVDDEGEYVMVTGLISSELRADATSVRFDASDMGQLIDAVDGMEDGELIVGWYHSHLGCGCFMSDTDATTQKGIFGKNIGFAIVIDPVLCQLKVFRHMDDDIVPAQMIVME